MTAADRAFYRLLLDMQAGLRDALDAHLDAVVALDRAVAALDARLRAEDEA